MTDETSGAGEFQWALLTCRDPEGFDPHLLLERAQGALRPEDVARVEAHLEACPHCAAYAEALLEVPPPPPLRLPEDVRPRRQRGWGLVGVAVAVAAAAIGLAVLPRPPPAVAAFALAVEDVRFEAKTTRGLTDAPRAPGPLRYTKYAEVSFLVRPGSGAPALRFHGYVEAEGGLRALPPSALAPVTQLGRTSVRVTFPVATVLGPDPATHALSICAVPEAAEPLPEAPTRQDVASRGGRCLEQAIEVVAQPER